MKDFFKYLQEILVLLGEGRRKLPLMVMFLGVLFDLAGLDYRAPFTHEAWTALRKAGG